MNKIFIRATDITMRKNHVVRKQGYFKVIVSYDMSLRRRYFHSFDLAYRYFRYHVSYLGWNYGILVYVDNSDYPSRILFEVDRRV